MGESAFGRKMAAALGRPLDGACAARPNGTLTVAPIFAGVGAGIGAVLGGPILAGVGGGLGALAGFLVAGRRARRRTPPLAGNMALVLDPQRFELHALGAIGTKPTELLLSARYAEVASVSLGENWLGVWAELELRSGERVELEAGKRGVAAGGDVFETLRERCGAVAAGTA